MKKFAYQYATGTIPQKTVRQFGAVDFFAASVINQKAINQNAQQILVLVAAQVLNITEAQFAFATNEDQDVVQGGIDNLL
ncbi:MAG TPA: hypothetical protein VFC74_10890 [Oscillospiraceae bacterium]|nr:hypothetical protein [Oscillospiraceae bacterium]